MFALITPPPMSSLRSGAPCQTHQAGFAKELRAPGGQSF